MNLSEFAENILAVLFRKLEQVTFEHIAVFLLAAVVWPCAIAFYRFGRWLFEIWHSRAKALSAVGRIGLLTDPREGDGPWALRPVHHPDNYRNNVAAAKILAVANYKGGVGKTTFTANIGQCLAIKHRLSRHSPSGVAPYVKIA